MKLNTFLLMGTTAITAVSGAVNAADEATAEIIWSGLIDSSVPSDNLIITGEGGGEIASGTLFIEKDGKFTSTEVILEARDYDSVSENVSERQPLATWSYIGAQVMMNGSMSYEADVEVTDQLSNTTFIQGTVDEVQSGVVILTVKNERPITDIAVQGEGQVSVQMTASYEAGL
ncbi:hypothetical protein [Vibrio hyugaensis]|uniref:hypothetical protein n=1 Tax=Vibrio hyugaensis TaxID=1534743 RepID=UPI000CE569EF|nr:hypothetical protein [Vibrio hyugaensis]